MPDAYTIATKGISKEELISSGCSEDRARDIFEVVPLVRRYKGLETLIRMGVTITPKDLDFDKGLIFAWIAEGVGSGRGN